MRSIRRGAAVFLILLAASSTALVAQTTLGSRLHAFLATLASDRPAAPEAGGTSRHRAAPHPTTIPPVATADSFTLNGVVTLSPAAPGVLDNDVLNGGVITGYGAVTGSEQTTIGTATQTSQHGSVALNADGSFTYTAASNFSGTDTFKYTLGGPGGESKATVTLVVIPPPAPVAVGDSYSVNAGSTLTVQAPGVLGNDTINGGQLVSFGASSGAENTTLGTSSSSAQGGSVTLSSDGSFSYTPSGSFSGSDSFKYVLRNGGGSSTGTVTISVQSTTPIDLNVTNVGFAYRISGHSGDNPPISLQRGHTYRFHISVDSIHPFEILGAPQGSVTNNNISNGTLTFVVPSAATSYAYECSIHGFGNTITTTP